ncbi:MAG TPA: NAD-dependent epimerase [Thermoanaerobaculia bacterium]|nr:NAD-dependent epimerase [Thermoanaerobaculia bacterium]
MERILVTGAAGFVGYHVTRALLRDGARVTGLDNLNDYYDPSLKHARLARLREDEAFTFVEADIAGRDWLDDVKRFQPEAVVHLAAQAGVRYSITNPEAYTQSNLVGFAHVLELCRALRVQHLVFASSSSVYGANRTLPYAVSHNVDHPISLYAATKKSNELMAHTYAHLYRIPVTGLRFFTVYGPWGRPDMAYFSFTKAILEGRPIELFNHGQMKRDFTYVDDVVAALVRVLRKPAPVDAAWDAHEPNPGSSAAPYRVYNIGNHAPVSLTDFVATIERALGVEAKKVLRPMQPGDVLETYADVEDLQRDFGFAPSTPLETGIRRFVEWYREYYGVGVRSAAG